MLAGVGMGVSTPELSHTNGARMCSGTFVFVPMLCFAAVVVVRAHGDTFGSPVSLHAPPISSQGSGTATIRRGDAPSWTLKKTHTSVLLNSPAGFRGSSVASLQDTVPLARVYSVEAGQNFKSSSLWLFGSMVTIALAGYVAVRRAWAHSSPAALLRPLEETPAHVGMFAALGRKAYGAVQATANDTEATPFNPLPKMVVLDLDECMWSPEMYTLAHMPSKTVLGPLGDAGEGVVGVMSGRHTIKLYPGALQALQEVHAGQYPEMRLAVASSADTPLAEQIGRAAMKILEVVPGVTMYDVITAGWEDDRALQIGRQPPLSPNKSRTHFPILREQTGVAYSDMLFFDDSVWSDHCYEVETNCPGVVTQRTPKGMQYEEWLQGLRKFARMKERVPVGDTIAMAAFSGLGKMFGGKAESKNYMADKIGNKVNLSKREEPAKANGDLVNVTFKGAGGVEQTIQVPNDRYILDTAIEQGIELPYSCRGGICGACVGRVTSGTTDMSDIDDVSFCLDEDQQADGFSLLCMARPVGDVTVETQSDWGMSLGMKDWEGPSGYIQGKEVVSLMGDEKDKDQPESIAMAAFSGLGKMFGGKAESKNYMADKIGNKVNLSKREEPAKANGDLVNVTFKGAGGVEQTIQVPNDRYILDTAIEQGIELPYSCRGGICGACVGRVTSGTTDMSDIDDVSFCLDEDQQADGFSLLCMARPVGDVTVETQSDWGMSLGMKDWEGPSGYIQGKEVVSLMGDEKDKDQPESIAMAAFSGLGKMFGGKAESKNYMADKIGNKVNLSKREEPAKANGDLVNVTFKGAGGVEQTIQVPNDRYILDTAIEQGIELPYSCRGGICGACVGRVTSGTTDMSDIDDVSFCLDEDQQADGFSLLCMARPVGDVTVETQSDWGMSLGMKDWEGPSGYIQGKEVVSLMGDEKDKDQPESIAMAAFSGLGKMFGGKAESKNYMADKIGNKVDLSKREEPAKANGDLVNVTFKGAGGVEQTIQVPNDRYILDTAIEQGIELPYSCRGGICGACVGRVTSGTTDMSDIDDVSFCLDEDQQADGFSLLCMARPVGDVTVETQSDWGMSLGMKDWEGPSGYIQGKEVVSLMGDEKDKDQPESIAMAAFSGLGKMFGGKAESKNYMADKIGNKVNLSKREEPAKANGDLVNVTFKGAGGVEQTIQVPNDRYILDTAIEQGIELPYSCRGGICGACVGRVTSGTTDMSDIDDVSFCLDEDQQADGFSLLCMARPVGDVTVETQSDWGMSLGMKDWEGPSGYIQGKEVVSLMGDEEKE